MPRSITNNTEMHRPRAPAAPAGLLPFLLALSRLAE